MLKEGGGVLGRTWQKVSSLARRVRASVGLAAGATVEAHKAGELHSYRRRESWTRLDTAEGPIGLW